MRENEPRNLLAEKFQYYVLLSRINRGPFLVSVGTTFKNDVV